MEMRRLEDAEDARKIRAAVWVLGRRARKKGFVFDVLCMTLRRIADGIEGGKRPINGDADHPCADGSLVHDFKEQSVCPACGFKGVTLVAPEGVMLTPIQQWAIAIGKRIRELETEAGGVTEESWRLRCQIGSEAQVKPWR